MNELLVIGNPAKRKRRRHKAKHVRRHRARSNPRRRHHRRSSFKVRARRNPIPFVGGFVPMLKGGAFGAVGGIANDFLYGFASDKLTFLPKEGLTRSLAKVASAIVVGKLGGMALRGKGGALASGAVTCALHDALRAQLSGMDFVKNYNLGEYIEEPAQLMHGYDPGMPVDGFMDEEASMGEMDEEGMGEYIEQ